MTDDLVKCPRNRANGFMHWVTVEQMATEAADRIEQIKELYLEYVDLAEERAARIKQLEAALREIEGIGKQYSVASGPAYAMRNVARAALGEKKNPERDDP